MQAFREPFNHPAPVSMAILGDSLAYGLGATCAENGLAHLLFRQMREVRPGSTFSNYGIPHSTMGDVLRHQVPQLARASASMVLLIAGANDMRFTRDVALIERRFRRLLESVHAAAPVAVIVAAGMPDITKTAGVPPLLKAAAARVCRRINDAMRRVIGELDDEFLDLFEYTSSPLFPDREYLCRDGYHPGDFGYAEIAERAYPTIERALTRL